MSIFFHFSASDWHPPRLLPASFQPCSLPVSCHVSLQPSVYSASYASCLSSSFPLLICRSDTGLTAFSARNVVSPEDFCWTNRIFAPKRS